MRFLVTLFVFIAFLPSAFTQVGIGTEFPEQAAALEISAIDKGILIPRVSLESLSDQTTITGTMIDGLLVFNTSKTVEIQAGFYYWYANSWHRIETQTVDFQDSPIVSIEDGTYTTVTASTNANHITYQIHVPIATGSQSGAISYGVVREASNYPQIRIQPQGELALNLENIHTVISVFSHYTIAEEDAIIYGNPISSDIDIHLPNPVNHKGKKYTVIKENSDEEYFINVIGNIAGVANQELYTAIPYSGWQFISDGVQWRIENKF